MALLHCLIGQVQGICDFLYGHSVIVFHADDVKFFRLQGLKRRFQIQAVRQRVRHIERIRHVGRVCPVRCASRGSPAGRAAGASSRLRPGLSARNDGEAGSLPVFAVRAYGLPAGDGAQKGSVRAFFRIIAVRVEIKFQEGVVDTFLHILRIFKIGGRSLPDQGGVLLHELFRRGKRRGRFDRF